jgi:spore germination cell wall hydrolase CwlJ-like protein
MAFAKPKIGGKEIQIATAFYRHEDKPRDPQVPVMLASWSPTTRPTSWPPPMRRPAPDFASQSPFRSLLKEPEAERQGRFIPPMAREIMFG